MTVGELKHIIKEVPDDHEVELFVNDGELEAYYQVKSAGEVAGAPLFCLDGGELIQVGGA